MADGWLLALGVEPVADRGIARVLFTVEEEVIVLLHCFVKKSIEMPNDLSSSGSRLTPHAERLQIIDERFFKVDLDELLREEGIIDNAGTVAGKRVFTFLNAEEMKHSSITKSGPANRLDTSRPVVEHLLDLSNQSVTPSTPGRAASAMGKLNRLSYAEGSLNINIQNTGAEVSDFAEVAARL